MEVSQDKRNRDGEEEEERKRGTGETKKRRANERNRLSRPGLRAIDT